MLWTLAIIFVCPLGSGHGRSVFNRSLDLAFVRHLDHFTDCAIGNRSEPGHSHCAEDVARFEACLQKEPEAILRLFRSILNCFGKSTIRVFDSLSDAIAVPQVCC
jgi:hypothetical protein